MNANERKQVRLSLLRHLDAAAAGAPGRGLSVGLLRQQVGAEGSAVTPAEVQAELIYLAEKGLVARKASEISPEVQGYCITAAGRDWFAENCDF